MHRQWMGCCGSNSMAGRAGFVPEAIVLHASGTTLAAIDARCAKSNTYNSVHYAVGLKGDIHQYVEEHDTAFHSGVVVNPTWTSIKPGKNPNLYTIGVELETGADSRDPQIPMSAAAALLAGIAERWKIPLDAEHVVLHGEIRAGAGCPAGQLDRAKLLSLAGAQQTAPVESEQVRSEVRVLRNANVREAARSIARAVRVARSSTTEGVLGFDADGERIAGNACWYRTEDGNYLWAGATDSPNPARKASQAPVEAVAVTMPVEGSASGVPAIDNLISGNGNPAISEHADPEAVRIVQDLLTCHGLPGVPTLLSSSYGAWNQKTVSAIQAFQQKLEEAVTGVVDKPVLRKLIEKPAVEARASRAYLTLVLKFPFTGMHKVLSLVAQMEGAGKFGALNRNTDRAGLSYGLIQWAQKPGRLVELLGALSAADRAQFVALFGGGNAGLADALLAHCGKQHGGVDSNSGSTLNAAFNLIDEPWLSRFTQAAENLCFQRVQVQLAIRAFSQSHSSLQQFAPDLVSERAVGFALDVANQFGDSGLEKIYARVRRPGMHEMDILEAIADETVARVADCFKAGVRARRDRFLETPFLSNQPDAHGMGIAH